MKYRLKFLIKRSLNTKVDELLQMMDLGTDAVVIDEEATITTRTKPTGKYIDKVKKILCEAYEKNNSKIWEIKYLQ